MNCKTCKVKLKCVASCPVGQYRYRVYKCSMCGKHIETVEVPGQELAYAAGLHHITRKGREYRNTYWKWHKAK